MVKKELLSTLPKVDEVLNNKLLSHIVENEPRVLVIEAIRDNINALRESILKLDDNQLMNFKIVETKLIEDIVKDVKNKNQMKLRRVINATGVVLHTNLGRALIGQTIVENLVDVACNYSTLEFDLESGKRGSRYSHIEELICRLTGSEAALVVNNNAAAVLLVLNTLSKDKEAIVSRGQLVEIGGSFRVPEVMTQSGAKLVEVGTTNKTHLHDYENNINEETGVILKVHTSNYKIMGFTKEVDIEDLSHIGNKYSIPVVEDIGSGTLIDLSNYGFTKEPTVQESIKKGADIVTFSGDKLLGGPQAGIIVGKKDLIDKMKKNQLTRALRVDKMTLVALEATMRLYLDEEKAIKKIPTLSMLSMDIKDIKNKAITLFERLDDKKLSYEFEIIEGNSQVGGGALPVEDLPTYLISLYSNKLSSSRIEEHLRKYKTPIIVRINDGKILFDLRTIKYEEFDTIIEALASFEGVK